MYLRYVGTDIPAFTKQFDRFQIVKVHRCHLVKEAFHQSEIADRRLKILAA